MPSTLRQILTETAERLAKEFSSDGMPVTEKGWWVCLLPEVSKHYRSEFLIPLLHACQGTLELFLFVANDDAQADGGLDTFADCFGESLFRQFLQQWVWCAIKQIPYPVFPAHAGRA